MRRLHGHGHVGRAHAAPGALRGRLLTQASLLFGREGGKRAVVPHVRRLCRARKVLRVSGERTMRPAVALRLVLVGIRRVMDHPPAQHLAVFGIGGGIEHVLVPHRTHRRRRREQLVIEVGRQHLERQELLVAAQHRSRLRLVGSTRPLVALAQRARGDRDPLPHDVGRSHLRARHGAKARRPRVARGFVSKRLSDPFAATALAALEGTPHVGIRTIVR